MSKENDFIKRITKKSEEKDLKIDKIKPSKEDRQIRLFNNPIDTERAFGMSRELTDKFKRLTEQITPEQAQENFKYNNKTFKVKESNIALRVIDNKQEIKTAEQFYNALSKIKSGKVLKTLMGLWCYANQQGSFVFRGVRLNKLMTSVLKKPKSGYYTQQQRKEFTKAIHQLRDFEIFLDQTITDTDEKGRKQKVIKRDFYKLIDLVGATYAKRKKDITDPETGRVIKAKGTADESVILKLYGELLPKFNKGIMRGRLYNRGLLELDANKDERAILLGFKLLTRFDQLRMGRRGEDLVKDDNLFIKTDRKTLIEWADYTKSDLEDKWTTNQYLKKTLDKLIKINCLRDYKPRKLTTNDDLKITLYPAEIAIKPPVKDDQTLKIEAPTKTKELTDKTGKKQGKNRRDKENKT
ncbi:hypothetical protein B6D52_02725 [Candidatus Parcubacteria bacterium 4484_255]|nr:MAG: hypothetical protein B6D52_02725 [Candidatus Parcubacteria bacterium 4484_255]